MTTIGSIHGTIAPHGHIHALLYDPPQVNGQWPVFATVSLNRAAKPGHIAFKRDGSILRSYRLGRWRRRPPQWVQDVVSQVMWAASL